MSRRLRLVSVLLGVALVIGAPPAFAGNGNGNGGNGGKGGKLTATIDTMSSEEAATFDAAGDGSMSFAVTRSTYDHKDIIWVTNTCYDADGNVISDSDRAVEWGEWNSLSGEAGAFEATGATCTAYVTTRPWRDQPLGDAIMTYTP